MPNCFVCKTPNASEQRGSEGEQIFSRYKCRRCGVFVLTDHAENVLQRCFIETPLRRSLMSYTLRRMQTPDGGMSRRLIRAEELPTFWSDGKLPSPLQQADNLVLWIGDNQAAASVWAETTVPAISATIGLTITEDGKAPRALFRVDADIYRARQRGSHNARTEHHS